MNASLIHDTKIVKKALSCTCQRIQSCWWPTNPKQYPSFLCQKNTFCGKTHACFMQQWLV